MQSLGCYVVWCIIQEDDIIHSHRRENLKSYIGIMVSNLTGRMDGYILLAYVKHPLFKRN
jgi:hypothetical protein